MDILSESSYFKTSELFAEVSNLSACFDPALRGHNFRVFLIALPIASKLSFSRNFLFNLSVASLFHDIGILFLKEREQESLLREENFQGKAIHLHAFAGYKLLNEFPVFKKAAEIIRDHHRTYLEHLANPGKYSFASQIVFLADRIDIWITNRLEKGESLLKAVSSLREKLERGRKTLFNPKLLDIFFSSYYSKEAFWFSLYTEEEYVKESVLNWLNKISFSISIGEFLKIVKLFGFIIDFKSPFTATHSSGVAQTATHLASYFHFSQEELRKIKIAGFLHDVGKVFIPIDILEKPARLTDNEFFIMKSHVFHTYRILSRFIRDDDTVKWASYHHERLNGKGYPFKLRANRIPLGSRIMAVADIFTALTENRPYKKALSSSEAMKILLQLAEKGEVNSQIVKTLEKNLKFIDRSRKISQEKAEKFYREIRNDSLLRYAE